MSATLSVYPFPGSAKAELSQVGGKAFSLLKGSAAGLPVPPGVALPVEFFASWFEQLKKTEEWSVFLRADSGGSRKACDDLKSAAEKLTYNDEQRQALSEALKDNSSRFFAVRSSSPEEDLEGTSFAGGYETILGVTRKTMEDAIKRAFASCLDFRIVAYKREHGFDVSDPKIAVVIQEQMASEMAGVGFSLNPVTNNYDETVINANWGLGESVVAGLATPDTFTVDKIRRVVKSRNIGSKEISIWLMPDGGTEEKSAYRSDDVTLSESEISDLTALIEKVEVLYGKPMDIEWAIAGGRLHLLQARPITAYVPLAPELLTAPGQKKRLYFDVTIGVQGIAKPISKMASSIFSIMTRPIRNIALATDGRLYANLSAIFAIIGKERFSSGIAFMDPLVSKALEPVDECEYRSENREERHLPLPVLRRLPFLLFYIFRSAVAPERAHERSQRALHEFEIYAREITKANLPLTSLSDVLLKRLIKTIFKDSIPLVLASRLALQRMKRLAKGAEQSDLERLELALPHNVTTEMGLALYHVAEQSPENLDLNELQASLQKGALPPAFLTAWQCFLDKYGHRGPEEIDIAAPRYRDKPRLLLDILITMRNSAEGQNPQEKFVSNQIERQKAYERLYEHVRATGGWLQGKCFAWLYRIVNTIGGYRETHKFYLVLSIDLLRQRVLKEARALHAALRLESVEQVFDLTLEELERGINDASLDLVQLARNNRVFIDRLARVPLLPTIIDSRGLILRPPAAEAREGEVVGMPISAGVARGRVKVLNAPDEKPLLKGEVLVARATDPGWTPLFVSAGAVILEVGGVLQHGALVAREYGLPCVAGIAGATGLWKDGTLVEVDGSAGIVRTLADEA